VNFPPNRAGGAERQALLQARTLAAMGHDVRVVCARNRGESRAPRVDGIEVTRFLTLRRPLERLSWAVGLAAFLVRNRSRTRLIHVHVANVQADVAVLAGRLIRRPVYVKVASGGISGEVHARRGRRFPVGRWYGLRHAQRVQALSPQIAQELGEAGVPPEKIELLPNGVDTDHFRPPSDEERAHARSALGLAPQDTVVAYLGRFARYKGAATLIGAWEKGLGERAKLLIIGARATEDPLEEIPRLPGLVVRPWTPDPRLVLHAADVFVHPALADGMPNAMLEAMACGLAVVGARTPAVVNVTGDEPVAVLFEPEDATGLHAALASLVDDPALRARLGPAARRRALDFDHHGVVERLVRAYASMADG
jgi:glycosyltransferase involved in cell wall biosynthesis